MGDEFESDKTPLDDLLKQKTIYGRIMYGNGCDSFGSIDINKIIVKRKLKK